MSFLVAPPCVLPENGWPDGIVFTVPPPFPYGLADVRPPVLEPEPIETGGREPGDELLKVESDIGL